jgi:hypothetical protein
VNARAKPSANMGHPSKGLGWLVKEDFAHADRLGSRRRRVQGSTWDSVFAETNPRISPSRRDGCIPQLLSPGAAVPTGLLCARLIYPGFHPGLLAAVPAGLGSLAFGCSASRQISTDRPLRRLTRTYSICVLTDGESSISSVQTRAGVISGPSPSAD